MFHMQTDPNPANFYFNKEKNLFYLIDFGACHEYSKQFIDNYIKVIYAATQQNTEDVLKYSKELGFLTGEENDKMKEAHVGTIKSVAEPFTLNQPFNFGQQDITKKAYEQIPVMLKYRLRPPPPEVYSLHRKFSGSFLLSMRLGARYNCYEMFHKLYQNYSFDNQ